MSDKNRIKNSLLGFRSNKAWKKLLSTVYLLFCCCMIIFVFIEEKKGEITVYDFCINKIIYGLICIWAVTPYIFFSETKLRNKLPLIKKHTAKSSAAAMLIISFAMLLIIGIVNCTHSLAYQDDMKDHAYIETSIEEASCEKSGKINYICEYCGKKHTETLKSLGHDMKEITIPESGQIVMECSRCGKQETKQSETSSNISETTATEKNKETEAAVTEKITELPKATESKSILSQDINSTYSKLSDDQFKLLTQLMAKSFYNFSLSDSECTKAENSGVMDCLTQIYDYAYANNFDVDPEFKKVFASKYEIVSEISNYDVLEENFLLDYYYDNEARKWIFNINSYSLDKESTVKYDDKVYVDADGYLDKDVAIYWIEDDKMVKVGKIKDIAYDTEIDGTSYAYALNVEFYDDPYSSGWRDGESFLMTNKNLSGKPLYYIDVLDVNRKIKKDCIDYNDNIAWKPLKKTTLENGTEVYGGIGSAKTFLFTIIETDKNLDMMLVEYPSGSIQYKSYSAMMNDDTLFVK